MVGEVQYGGPLGEFQQVALGREDEHLIVVEVHLELLHGLHAVARLQHGAYVAKPLILARVALDAFVPPVGSHAALGYLVHALSADLHFHPFLLRSQHCDVQALVTV